MANAAGMLKESIWRDKDFRDLPRTAQATYAQLISQKELDRAGIQPLQVSKWTKGCTTLTEADFWDDLKVLEAHRFVYIDEDTDELFVRSYMRHCEVARYPNILKNALRCAGMVASEKLRHELAKELRRLRKADADRVADTIEPADFKPEIENGSETQSNPSETVPETVPSGLTVPEPFANPGDRDRDRDSSYVCRSLVGRGAEKTRTDETAPNWPRNAPPPEHCTKHPNGTTDPCGGCRAAREHRQRWEETTTQLEADRRAARRADIDNCQLCDPNGLRDIGNHAVRCTHEPIEVTNHA